MPYKLNSRQYRFCLNILAGMPQPEAYVKAGYNPLCASECASRLLTLASVKQFVEAKRRQQEAVILANSVNETLSPAVLSKAEKRSILANFARAQLSELLDDSGNIKLDKKSPSAKALKEWYHRERTDRNGNAVITRSAKLIDPIAAIIEDNKMMGDYAPTRHLVGHAHLDVIFADEDKGKDDNTSDT